MPNRWEKHPGTGVRVRVTKSTPEPDETNGNGSPPASPRGPEQREDPAPAEGSTSQNAIENTVAKILHEALPQALANALPSMAKALKAMMDGEKPKDDAAMPAIVDPVDELDKDDDEGLDVGPRREGKEEMPPENEEKNEESRQILERAQSLLGGGPRPGDLGSPAAAPAALSPLGALLASCPDRGNPMRARKFPILGSVVSTQRSRYPRRYRSARRATISGNGRAFAEYCRGGRMRYYLL